MSWNKRDPLLNADVLLNVHIHEIYDPKASEVLPVEAYWVRFKFKLYKAGGYSGKPNHPSCSQLLAFFKPDGTVFKAHFGLRCNR